MAGHTFGRVDGRVDLVNGLHSSRTRGRISAVGVGQPPHRINAR